MTANGFKWDAGKLIHMGLLQKLKSVLGMDGSDRSRRRADPDVTVEREPSTASEQAVKGNGPSDAPRAPRSANAASADEEPADVEAAAEEVAETEEVVEGDSPAVEEVNGIGPTYAERLEAAGIATVADLAASEVATVADAAQTNESRVEDWIQQAKDW